jgi:hypothetical protein
MVRRENANMSIERIGERTWDTDFVIPDSPETEIPAMTDAELVAVIINDPDTATRRKALHVLRIREFTAGTKAATVTFTGAMDALLSKVPA